MSRSNVSKLVAAAGRVLLTVAFVFSQSAWAGQDQKTNTSADSAQKAKTRQVQEKQTPAVPEKTGIQEAQSTAEARYATEEGSVTEEKSSGDGSHEPIKVHGHWTIDVRNPDGTLVSHREFENSLQQGSGPLALAALLGHQNTAGFWDIALFVSPNCGASNIQACALVESSSGLSSIPSRSNNLAANVTNNGASLTLTGSIQAPVAIQITSVQTGITLCPPSTTSMACTQLVSAQGYSFTLANRTTPDVVQAGQIVQVTVVISFS